MASAAHRVDRNETAPVHRADARLEQLEAAVVALRIGLAELRAIVRDRVDVDDDAAALLEALAVHVDGGDFGADDVAYLIAADPRFTALAAAAAVTPDRVSYWLRGLAGVVVGPHQLVRIGRSRPARWRFA